MLTYSTLASIIKNISTLINQDRKKEAIQKIAQLKQSFIEFLENFLCILNDIENKKISFALYKILFTLISEFALDLDALYADVIKNDLSKKSRLSLILEKLNLEKEIKWFNLVNDIMLEIMNFMEYHYEAQPSVEPYSLSKEEIEKKINELKVI